MKGIIFDSKDSSREFYLVSTERLGMIDGAEATPPKAEVSFARGPSALKRTLFRSFQFMGASITSFAMAAFMVTYSPLVSANYTQDLVSREANGSEEQESVKAEAAKNARFNAKKSVFQEADKYGVDTNFSIVVPAIDAKSRVIAGIDPYNEAEYSEALKAGIAHAKGTYKPGQGKSVYLFAHSTNSPLTVSQYNAVFYQLKRLLPGSRIIVFYDMVMYEYEVVEKLVVDANDTSWLTPTDGEKLILQTCDPPGTTWKRLLVIAKPV